LGSDNINKWLTLVANFGVLAGILLLGFEIDQANRTTRAEMISIHQDRWIAIDQSWQEADFAIAWARAIESPEDLTIAEMIQISGHLWAYMDHISSLHELEELGFLSDEVGTAQSFIGFNTRYFFGNEFAQKWWHENKDGLDPDIVLWTDAAIKKTSSTRDLEYYERMKPSNIN